MTTRYDAVAGHPLAGVPVQVLNVARWSLATATDADLSDEDEREAVADMIVSTLHTAGYVTWPRRLPMRTTLVAALVDARLRWEAASAVPNATVPPLTTYLVDEVVVPLLRAHATATRPASSLRGSTTPNPYAGRVDARYCARCGGDTESLTVETYSLSRWCPAERRNVLLGVYCAPCWTEDR